MSMLDPEIEGACRVVGGGEEPRTSASLVSHENVVAIAQVIKKEKRKKKVPVPQAISKSIVLPKYDQCKSQAHSEGNGNS
jgi:hypothetical protein